MTAEQQDLANEAAERGAAWLDEHIPGWLERVDLGRLDMASLVDCVLAQAGGDDWGSVYRAHDLTVEETEYLGFEAANKGRVTLTPSSYEALDAAWNDLVNRRRLEASL
jgi:hypothetical protein